MQDRLSLARCLLSDDGVIFTSIGDLNPQEGESFRLQLLQSMIFPKRFGNLIWKKRNGIGSFSEKNLTENHEYITVFGNEKAFIYKNIITQKQEKEYKHKDEKGAYKWMGLLGPSQQTKEKRPNLNYGIIIDTSNCNIIGFEYNQNGEKRQELFSDKYTADIDIIYPKGNYTWLISRDVLKKYYQQGLIKVFKEKSGYSVKIKRYLFKPDGMADGSILKSILTDNGVDIGLNADATRELNDLFYPNDYSALKPKPVSLVKLLIHTTTKGGEIVCDFFAGSGTTAHAVMKLNKEDGGKRKFILVEMGDYFDKIIIPKIKKIAYSFNWKNGKPQDADGIGGFFKYYELEQFEEALSNTVYEDHDLSIIKDKTPYEQYIFLKDEEILKILETDYENGKIKIDLNKLYPNIDIAETLSNLTGKWIKRVEKDQVEFEDGGKIDIKDLDYKLIKPLIWWE
jgi:adenine-specific DNA-methyltransferase